jgi:hypothetical protein
MSDTTQTPDNKDTADSAEAMLRRHAAIISQHVHNILSIIEMCENGKFIHGHRRIQGLKDRLQAQKLELDMYFEKNDKNETDPN